MLNNLVMYKSEEIKERKEREVSNTHYVVIDCAPNKLRPDNILKMIITDNPDENDIVEEDALMYDDNDNLSENDFHIISAKLGEWKFGVYKDKEQVFEENLYKLISHLTSLYNSNIIRYAEWRPK
jgi:hypothetical protein